MHDVKLSVLMRSYTNDTLTVLSEMRAEKATKGLTYVSIVAWNKEFDFSLVFFWFLRRAQLLHQLVRIHR